MSGLLEQDEPEQAADVLALGDQMPAPEGFFAAWRQHAIERLAAYRGEHAQALEAFLTVGRRHTELMVVNPTVLPWRSEAGLAAQRLGRYEFARELVTEELLLADRFGGPRAIGVAGILAACGARIELARALLDLGGAIRRAGRPAEARGTLREALALAERTGATALGRQAREELRLAGGRAPAAADTAGDGLTAGERRVADLAAAGHSNRQIADALFVTVKSVEWHLGGCVGAHGIGVRRGNVVCCAVGDPGMDSDSGVELRVGCGHYRCHRAAGGESGDVHPGWVDRVVGHDLAGDAGDDRRLAG